jgi:hypothetical protein
MKRNTGCGSDHKCPPAEPCNPIEARRVDCDFKGFKPKGEKLKVPVIDALVPLAEVEVEADVEADIHLPEGVYAREIKRIRKNISIKQCKAVESSKGPWFVKLFITGIIHKNIEFVDDCDGTVKHFSTDVHFTCSDKVKLRNPIKDPWGDKGVAFSSKSSDNFEYRELSDDGMGANRCVTGSKTWEVFNEPIECKILGSHIREMDLLKNFNQFGQFDRFTEKMEVTLWIKLSQMQQVKIEQDDDHGDHPEPESPESPELADGAVNEKTVGDRFKETIRKHTF